MTMLARTLGLVVLFASATGCIVEDDDDHYYHHDVPPDPSGAFYTTIDAGVPLTADPGEGIGVMVEYHFGGYWTIWTVCDTYFSGYGCSFEVSAISAAPITQVFSGDDLEPDDTIQLWDDYSLTYYSWEDFNTDTMEFATTPGELVDMELLLDGYLEPFHFRWQGNGIVHNEGAPRSPVVFQPDQP